MANNLALLAARHEHFPHVREEGWRHTDRPVGFSAQQSHYSIKRGAMIAGMGMNQIISVPSERYAGSMIPEALEEAIYKEKAKGNNPFFVNSTMGSTVIGGFDDSHAISDICKRHGLWHHMDACWGGLFAFSNKTNYLFDGAEKADSVALCVHKGLSVPQQCSYLITNNKLNALEASNHSGATYLFHKTDYSQYDLGDKTLSCARHADALKMWMMFKRHGKDGLSNIADWAMDMSKHLHMLLEAQPDKFEMVNKPMANNICFSYSPKRFRNGDVPYTYEDKCEVHKEIFSRMQKEGTVLVQHQPLEEFALPNFFRVVIRNSQLRKEDLEYILSEIDRLGQDL